MTRRPTRPVERHPHSRALQHILNELCIDREMNLAMIEPVLAPQCHLRIGNDPPSLGRDRVVRDLARFLLQVRELGAGYFDAWRCRDTMIVEMDCVMVCPAGMPVTVPSTAILRLTGMQVADIRIYIDRRGLMV